jgi:hypothetical protein
MGNLKGLVPILTQLKHIDAALSVLGKLNGGSSYTKPRHTLSAAPGAESTIGEESVIETSTRSKTQANNVSCSPQEDRGTPAGEVG